MSAYPPDQRCPRCQYPLVPGATTCANCGLALTGAQGAFPGSNPAYPLPPTQQSSGGSYGAPPAADPYGGAGNPGGAGTYGSQPPTIYGGSGTMNSAPTMRSPLYPPGPGGSQPQQPGYQPPPAPPYPGSQPQGTFGSAPAYAGPPTAYGGQPGTFGSAPPYGRRRKKATGCASR